MAEDDERQRAMRGLGGLRNTGGEALTIFGLECSQVGNKTVLGQWVRVEIECIRRTRFAIGFR